MIGMIFAVQVRSAEWVGEMQLNGRTGGVMGEEFSSSGEVEEMGG